MVMTDEEDWMMEDDFHSWVPIQMVTTDQRRVGSGWSLTIQFLDGFAIAM
jgi:hypothetical protein